MRKEIEAEIRHGYNKYMVRHVPIDGKDRRCRTEVMFEEIINNVMEIIETKQKTLHGILPGLGFTKIDLGTTCVDSYSSSANTTVHRYEKDRMWISIGLMGKLHQEMVIGFYDDIKYKKPLQSFTEEEIVDLIDKIKAGIIVQEIKHEDYL